MFAQDQTREAPGSASLLEDSADHMDTLEKLRDQLLQIEDVLNRSRKKQSEQS
jgi:hypothetical protein